VTLLDTSVLLAHLRGDARATELLTGVTNNERLASDARNDEGPA
jgi:hypothetical protein